MKHLSMVFALTSAMLLICAPYLRAGGDTERDWAVDMPASGEMQIVETAWVRVQVPESGLWLFVHKYCGKAARMKLALQ